MLYVLEDMHMSRGSGNYYLAVEAENVEEAEKMANEYISNDSRVLNIPIPLFKAKMMAYESMCPVVITKDNFQEVCKNNPFKKKQHMCISVKCFSTRNNIFLLPRANRKDYLLAFLDLIYIYNCKRSCKYFIEIMEDYMKVTTASSSDLLKRLNEIDDELQDFHISAHKSDLLYKEQDSLKSELQERGYSI